MDIQKLINDYVTWLKSEITFGKIGEYYEITTPYLDSANDYLQLYIKQEGDTVYFTDDSQAINNLRMKGIRLNAKRREQLEHILLQYGAQLDGEAIVSKSFMADFPQKKHLFIQAMLRVDDIFVAQPRVPSLFLDDVQAFFNEQEIYYTDNVQFMGKSGFSHNYDFLIQRSKNRPERLCQTVNSPNKSAMSNILFAWGDTRPARKKDSQLIIILNDQNDIKSGVEEAFCNYDAKVVRWSNRTAADSLNLLAVS